METGIAVFVLLFLNLIFWIISKVTGAPYYRVSTGINSAIFVILFITYLRSISISKTLEEVKKNFNKNQG